MHGRIVVVVVAALLGACKKDTGKPGAAVTPKAPASTVELDALWARAPEGAVFGAVISPRGVGLLEGAATELTKLAATAPELAPLKQQLDAAMQDALGTSVPALASAGMSRDKGAAVFAVPGGRPIVILPVTDRDKFLAVVKGTKGADGDLVGRATCKVIDNVYACGQRPELLATLGKGDLAKPRALAGARGDIEVAGLIAGGGGLAISAVAQLERGAVVVRGAVTGLPPQVTAMMANAKPRTDGDKTAGFSVLELGPLLAKVPPAPIANGVTLDQLARSIAGAVTITIASGATTFDVRVPLSDAAPARTLLAQCDQLPPLQQIGATVKDGACHVDVPQLQMKLDGWIDGQQLRIGDRAAPPASRTAPLSALGNELAAGAWTVALYGRGTVFGPQPFPVASADVQAPNALMGVRAMTLLNELGIGVRRDGDAVRFVVGARTAWANPDDVVAKLLAIDPAKLLDGSAGAAGKAIADASPGSPFAGDYAAGYGGLMLSSGALGMIAAVAIPAYMDYMKRGRRTEAELQLDKLGKNLETLAAVEGAFPKGTVGPTPSASCCAGANAKCADAAAWQQPLWQQLDFQLDEPHLFRYAYESDGTRASVKAIADLDCDGVEVTWLLSAELDAQGNVTTNLFAPPRDTD